MENVSVNTSKHFLFISGLWFLDDEEEVLDVNTSEDSVSLRPTLNSALDPDICDLLDDDDPMLDASGSTNSGVHYGTYDDDLLIT